MSKTPTLKVAVANNAPLAALPSHAHSADPRPLTVAERLLALHERLLGSVTVTILLERFLGWAEAHGMGEGLTYTSEDWIGTEPLTLGQTRHHNVTYQLVLENASLGALTVMRRERFSETELLIMERAFICLCHYLKMALDLQSYQRQAMHDGLTGLLNRKSLDARLAQELSKAQRHGTALSMMLIDVDHFKDLNDRLGHLSGDHTLRTLADIFNSVTRESDLVFRYGGDEFAILLPSTDLTPARCTAERIRQRLKDMPAVAFSLADDSTHLRPDLSIGIAQYVAGDADMDLLQRADTHLYHAKARGRGNICARV
ncbi:MAG: GGDEF domain-containing protein [Chromatocurvus sp.]